MKLKQVFSITLGLTVGRVPRLALYRPIAIALAIVLLLPPLSWFTSPPSGNSGGFAQAGAQIVVSGCGYGYTAPITISPLSATLTAGAQQQFTVKDANGCPVSVLWQDQNGNAFSGPGTMDASNLYTAPSSISQTTLVPLYAQVAGIGIISPGPGAASVSITLNPCSSATILKAACGSGTSAPPYQADLLQLESDAINAYLGLHNLPASDAHIVYDYGRTDLRNAIRGIMFSTLLGIIAKPASARTTHEQDLYTWLQGLVQKNEIAEYQDAVNQFNSWKANPCGFTLDPDIAKQYGLSYDGSPFCYQTDLSAFSLGPPVPAGNYFVLYGLTRSYGAPASTYGNFGSLLAETAINVGEAIGIGTAAGGYLASVVGTGVYTSTSAVLTVFNGLPTAGQGGSVTVGATASEAGASDVFVVGGETVDALGSGFLSAGPVTIVLIAAAIAVAAGMQVFTNQQEINDLNNLNNTLNSVTNTPPDLNAFAIDSSGLGMEKLNETLTAETLPDNPSTAALPSPRSTDPQFIISNGAPTPTLTYQDWNGISWSAQLYGGWFVQTCNSGSKCPQANSILGSLRYVDPSGTQWTASRIGQNFVSTKAKPASTDVPCPASTTTGVTAGSDFSNCSSYVSASIPLKAADGNNITVSLTPLPTAPAFTSASSFGFTTSQGGTATITASGYPAPAIALASGSVLPAGFTFASGNGSATLSYSPSAGAAGETASVSLTASNAQGSAQQTISITVATPVTLVFQQYMDVNMAMPIGCSPFQGILVCSGQGFLVTATGYPTPHLTLNGDLFHGMTFTDNGNGTATIAGTPDGSADYNPNGMPCGFNELNGEYPVPCTSITASNGSSQANEKIFFNPIYPPSAALVSSTANFTAGVANQMTVRSSGAVTPVTYRDCAGSNVEGLGSTAPSWLTFQDNGDGTGILSGTPPAGTSGSYSFCLQPTVFGWESEISNSSLPTNFTVNVNSAPLFLNPTISGVLTVGSSGSVDMTLTDGTVSSNAALPQGLTLSTGGSTASITGTPAPGTGGAYYLQLTGTNSTGTTSQELELQIQEQPQITSANSATFLPNQQGSFVVTTTGYPSDSAQPVSQSSTGTSSTGQGMSFTVTGLPPGLQASNLDAEGFATGTLTIQTVPGVQLVPGTYAVTIIASNGVGSPATQTLTITIPATTATAPKSGSKCNGAYTGTFTGNVSVSAGQNCSFIGGGINGNVTVMGGTFSLSNATVTGNVSVQGSASFSTGPGTQIEGNLSIDNVASGVAMNQVCGTKVSGNLEAYYDATPLQVGSAQADACPGNYVGGDLNLNNNTAAISVFGNEIVKTLSCGSNTSITGGSNVAAGKLGQCAAF